MIAMGHWKWTETNQSVPLLLQLVDRSICRGSGCLSPGLDIWEGVHQSSLESNQTGAHENPGTRSGHNSSSASVEGTTTVQPIFNVGGLATPTTEAGDHQPHRSGITGSSVSRVEHLRV